MSHSRADARRFYALATAAAVVLGSLGFAAPAAANEEPVPRVTIIVGPVGEELTPVYIALADAAAAAATERGAEVATAYSPDATAERVLAAVEGANIVVYFGHGIGTPNPYSATPNPAAVNGWGLNGAKPNGHVDSVREGSLAYYGEAWIAEHARPAPGWVMIYSNACYAPGAGEGQHDPADEATAATRVSAYSRGPLADLGASAYFATDYFEGAAHLVGALLDDPARPYGDVFATEPRFVADGLARFAHDSVDGAETWLHRSAYFEGKVDYWYAFAGDPNLSLSGHTSANAWQPGDVVPTGESLTALAASYAESPGYEGQPTVVLPAELAALVTGGRIEVCAERCATLPVVAELPVDASPAAAGRPQPAIALSQHAWVLVTDQPLGADLLAVRLRLGALPARHEDTPPSSPTAVPVVPPPPPAPGPEASQPTPSPTPWPLPAPSVTPDPTASPTPTPPVVASPSGATSSPTPTAMPSPVPTATLAASATPAQPPAP